MSRSVVIGTAGHIDHGKSTLVQALTGIDPDRLQEEKARGITIDLGFAHLERGGVSIAFVDVPGHERFVRNMLAGAGGIDAVVLVVAADEGVKPQTREHFEICRLLGVERGLVALTKADLADADMRALAAIDVRELVAGSFLDGAPVMPVSARTGEGLDALVNALAALTGAMTRRARAGVVRLPIDRVFTVRGFGTVVTGTLVSGRLAVGDALVVEPGARPVRVRGLHVHGAAVGEASAPRRVAANLAGLDAPAIARGDTLATPHTLAAARRVDVHLRLLASAGALRHGARVRVHQGTGDALGRVSIAAVRAGADEAWRAAQAGDASVSAPPGGEALVRIRLETPLVLTRHDRVVLRTSAPVGTIGGGAVLDPEPAATGVRRPGTLDRLVRLSKADVALDVWLHAAGRAGLPAATLVRRAGASPDEAEVAVHDAVERGQAVQVDAVVFAADVATTLEEAIVADLAAWHRAHPADAGPPREAVRARAGRRAAAALFEYALDRLRAAGRVTGTDRLALATHRAVTTSDVDRAGRELESMIRDGGLTPPDLAAVAAKSGLAAGAVDQLAQRLGREKRLVRVETLWFHPTVLARLREDVRALGANAAAGTPATVDVATFKTKFGLTRKFAMPLLEWLDRERITRRVGDRRVIL